MVVSNEETEEVDNSGQSMIITKMMMNSDRKLIAQGLKSTKYSKGISHQ